MTIHEWFDQYAESHQHPTNKLIHYICVPAIFFSIIGLLSLLRFDFGSEIIPESLHSQMHAGTLGIIFVLVFFSRLSQNITIGLAIFCFFLLKLIAYMNATDQNVLIISLTVFALGWIGQFIGHKIEGKKPAFLDDLKFLLIGPAWILGHLYKKFRISI